MVPYMQWNSNVEILKDPPSGYHLPGTDLLRGLNLISKNVTEGAYKNECEFQIALYRLFNSGYDFHLSYSPDVIGRSFVFGTYETIVSVSIDGQQLPQLYIYSQSNLIEL